MYFQFLEMLKINIGIEKIKMLRCDTSSEDEIEGSASVARIC